MKYDELLLKTRVNHFDLALLHLVLDLTHIGTDEDYQGLLTSGWSCDRSWYEWSWCRYISILMSELQAERMIKSGISY